jgi:thiol-disulfide isomerase/thioredoxin
MSIAPLLLAFLSVAGVTENDSTSGAVLLNFHAQWCGPCRTVRPAVEQLIRDGYPIKRIDIDEDSELPRRYRVKGVPTFIVIDRAGQELGRISGPRSASDLARFYKTFAAKAQPPEGAGSHVGSHGDRRSGDDDEDAGQDDEQRDLDKPAPRPRKVSVRRESEADRAEPAFFNPKPWETVVRIRIVGSRSTGFGSGTVISSTEKESVILTCAHIFKIDGRKPVAPKQFPRRIMIDLFDGKLKGTDPAQVHFVESVEGEAIDYDFTLDVGLIRMRPGRVLPASRVVPASWDLQSRMQVLAMGCPEGRDATAWHTVVRRPRIQNFLSGNPNYEAIECDVAPKEGRSGGGLYTADGYVAGVCNFAEPQGNHGLYATPRSIHSLLNRNRLSALYAPINRDSGNLIADRGPAGRSPRRSSAVDVVRSQSPAGEERDRSREDGDEGDLLIPAPSLLGIADPAPVMTRTERKPVAASGTTRRASWQATVDPEAAGKSKGKRQAEPSDQDRDDSVDGDSRNSQEDAPRKQEREFENEDVSTRTNSAMPSKARWKVVKLAPATDADSSHEN